MTTNIILSVLLALAYLQVKHAVADYFLQTPYQHQNKGQYGHPGGLLHAGFHILLTLPLFYILPPTSGAVAFAILAAEFTVHYHLDWGKQLLVRHYNWTPKDARYWHAFGLDQLAHNLTYVAMIAALIWSQQS